MAVLARIVIAFALIVASAMPSFAQGVSGPRVTLSRQFINTIGIATTSTDALVIQNPTLSTAAVPVQQSGRLRFRSHVWNTTITAADNTDDWFIESVPASGATPSGLLKFGSSLNGAAATFPFTLTSAGLGSFTALDVSSSITGNGSVRAGAASLFYWNARSKISAPANGQANWLMENETTGVGIDFATLNVLKVRTIAQTGYATVDALGYLAEQASITAGTHATVVNTGEIRGTVVYKATVTATTCLAPFAAAALTADCVVATLPAKTKITAVYADTTVGWTCSGTCTGTKVLVLGKSAGGTEYLASNTVATDPVTRGLVDAELGTELVAAARIQGGAIVNWTGTTTVTARFTSGTGNWGDGTTFVNAGSTTFYIETVVYP